MPTVPEGKADCTLRHIMPLYNVHPLFHRSCYMSHVIGVSLLGVPILGNAKIDQLGTSASAGLLLKLTVNTNPIKSQQLANVNSHILGMIPNSMLLLRNVLYNHYQSETSASAGLLLKLTVNANIIESSFTFKFTHTHNFMPFIPEGVGRGAHYGINTLADPGIESEIPCSAVTLATIRPMKQSHLNLIIDNT
ncbi:hypothetical protein SFRURICE_010985, partial [Spodoptera frugiperda]